jgi:hypothetical protein
MTFEVIDAVNVKLQSLFRKRFCFLFPTAISTVERPYSQMKNLTKFVCVNSFTYLLY